MAHLIFQDLTLNPLLNPLAPSLLLRGGEVDEPLEPTALPPLDSGSHINARAVSGANEESGRCTGLLGRARAAPAPSSDWEESPENQRQHSSQH